MTISSGFRQPSFIGISSSTNKPVTSLGPELLTSTS